MKKIILFLFLCSISLFGQDSLKTPSRWTIVVEGAIQEHDKRLFTYSERQTLWDKHPERFGTYQWDIRANRKILDKRFLEVSAGVGLSTELSTFTRPFNHLYKKGFGFQILLATNRYYKNLLQLPVSVHFPIGKHIKIGIEALPQFDFRTIATIPRLSNLPIFSGDALFYPTTWWRFDFYSLEINPSLVWVGDKYSFGVKYRYDQFKRIDPIIFNTLIDDPRTDEVYERYNPFKLWFSMGYRL